MAKGEQLQMSRYSQDYSFIDQILCDEHGWSQNWFYSVDPSPGKYEEWALPLSYHFSFRKQKDKLFRTFESRVIDRHGRKYATDVQSLCTVGRRIIFLPEPSEGQIGGFQINKEYIADLTAVGISPSLLGKPLEIVNFSGELIWAKVVEDNEQDIMGKLRYDFSSANKSVENHYRDTKEIMFGAYLLLWHDRVLLSKEQRRSSKKGSRLVGGRIRWRTRVEIQMHILRQIADGCPSHPEYRPTKRNIEAFCKKCDHIFTLKQDLATLQYGHPVGTIDRPAIHRR